MTSVIWNVLTQARKVYRKNIESLSFVSVPLSYFYFLIFFCYLWTFFILKLPSMKVTLFCSFWKFFFKCVTPGNALLLLCGWAFLFLQRSLFLENYSDAVNLFFFFCERIQGSLRLFAPSPALALSVPLPSLLRSMTFTILFIPKMWQQVDVILWIFYIAKINLHWTWNICV